MKYLYILTLLFLYGVGYAQSVEDPRICNDVKRDSRNRILRDQNVLRDFQKLYPCPSTGRSYGSCPDFSIDHVIPLACGGCDSIINLQWLPNVIKSCNKDYCKDRFERRIYKNKFNHTYCN